MSLRKKNHVQMIFLKKMKKNITYKKQFLEKSAITTTIKNYYDIKKYYSTTTTKLSTNLL